MATTILYDTQQNLNLGILPVHVCGPLSKLRDRYVHTSKFTGFIDKFQFLPM